jgi:hypothetical protein
MYSCAEAIMLPQVGLVGGTPAPRNESAASLRMEKANTMCPAPERRGQIGQQVHDDHAPSADAKRFRRLNELQLAQPQCRAACVRTA